MPDMSGGTGVAILVCVQRSQNFRPKTAPLLIISLTRDHHGRAQGRARLKKPSPDELVAAIERPADGMCASPQKQHNNYKDESLGLQGRIIIASTPHLCVWV